MNYKTLGRIILVATTVLGCTGVPKDLEPVSEFDGQRYMGKWYEIARLDHSFERNLSNVSATYARDSAGVISVTNRGYNEKTDKWKQIEGRARFIGDNTVGSLKVSFFGPSVSVEAVKRKFEQRYIEMMCQRGECHVSVFSCLSCDAFQTLPR